MEKSLRSGGEGNLRFVEKIHSRLFYHFVIDRTLRESSCSTCDYSRELACPPRGCQEYANVRDHVSVDLCKHVLFTFLAVPEASQVLGHTGHNSVS